MVASPVALWMQVSYRPYRQECFISVCTLFTLHEFFQDPRRRRQKVVQFFVFFIVSSISLLVPCAEISKVTLWAKMEPHTHTKMGSSGVESVQNRWAVGFTATQDRGRAYTLKERFQFHKDFTKQSRMFSTRTLHSTKENQNYVSVHFHYSCCTRLRHL